MVAAGSCGSPVKQCALAAGHMERNAVVALVETGAVRRISEVAISCRTSDCGKKHTYTQIVTLFLVSTLNGFGLCFSLLASYQTLHHVGNALSFSIYLSDFSCISRQTDRPTKT